VLNLGGFGVHVPFSVTWQHEKAAVRPGRARFRQIKALTDLPGLLE
jgi:putative hydrolase of the HAD superfamily